MYEKTLSRMRDLLPQIEGMLTMRSRIAIKAKGRILFIDPADVVTVEAQGNYVLLQRIHPWTTGEYVLRIKGGKEFHVSRTYKKNLHSITPLWFGTDGFRAG